MAVNTIGGTASNSVSGRITSQGGTTIPFNARPGDAIQITCSYVSPMSSNPNSDYASTALLFSGGSYGNSFAALANGTSSTFTTLASISSLTVRPVPFNWTNTTVVNHLSNTSPVNIASNGGDTLLIGGNGNIVQGVVRYSTDGGATWANTGTLVAPGTAQPRTVGYDSVNARWWVINNVSGSVPQFSTLLSGAWSLSTGGSWSGVPYQLAIGNGIVLAYQTGSISYNEATNVTAFTTRSFPVNAGFVKYVNNIFVMGGSSPSSTFYTSSNGVTWTARTITGWSNTFGDGLQPYVSDCVYVNGVYHLLSYATVATEGFLTTSTDGITWTMQNPQTIQNQVSATQIQLDVIDSLGLQVSINSDRALIVSQYPINNGTKPIRLNRQGNVNSNTGVGSAVYVPSSNTLVTLCINNAAVLRTTASGPLAPVGFTVTNLTQGYTPIY